MRVTLRKSEEPFRSLGFMLSTLGYATSRAFHRALAPLERRPPASDRRVRNLHLTSHGRELLDEAMTLATAHEQRIGEALSNDERRQLLDLLDKVAASAGLTPGVH